MSRPFSLLEDSDSDVEFKVNKSYADRYDAWRNKEELQKLKDLSKDISDSSSESEEEEIPTIEKDFLKTLSLLKSRDPKIYSENVEFFKNEAVEKKPKVKKEKPMFLREYETQAALQTNGEFSDNEEFIPAKGPTFKEEEEEIKKCFKEVLKDSEDDAEENEEDSLFQVRSKTKVQEQEEEADYMQWLKGQKKEVAKDTEQEMSYLKKFWNDPGLDEGEKFLRDYILNEKYKDNDKSGEIPTYHEIVDDIEDEKLTEQQELFEHKYNFRFEEPDTEFIKRYPRTIGDSLRRSDNKRKMKREDYSERKKKEKEQKKEELKRLKALKRKEIEEKFLKLKEVSGREEINFGEEDMESDFDPEKHDQKMKELFNDDYYAVEEIQKPEFEYDDELDFENWDKWTREQSTKEASLSKHEDSDDKDDKEEGLQVGKNEEKLQFEQEMIDATTGRKKRKKKSLFAKIVSQPKPVFDPEGKSFENYLDEYYKLDYEDIIGDLPVRFKYRKVIPNDFGLTPDEILAAHDKELNRWCSVKKTCQYRRDEEEWYDVQAFKKKAVNATMKQKCLSSVYSQPKDEVLGINDNNNDTGDSANKPKRKKRKNKNKSVSNPVECKNNEEGSRKNNEEESVSKSPKKRKMHSITFADEKLNEQDDGHFAAKKIKTENLVDTLETGTSLCQTNSDFQKNDASQNPSPSKRKRKKNKKNRGDHRSFNQHSSNNQNFSAINYPSKFNAQSLDNETSKKLALSDSRLAAFGINPKKFKNNLIYSQKT